MTQPLLTSPSLKSLSWDPFQVRPLCVMSPRTLQVDEGQGRENEGGGVSRAKLQKFQEGERKDRVIQNQRSQGENEDLSGRGTHTSDSAPSSHLDPPGLRCVFENTRWFCCPQQSIQNPSSCVLAPRHIC